MDHGLADLMQLDEDIESFIHEYVDSFVKWEIVQFFYEHPRTEFKLQDMAKLLNRGARQVKPELEELSRKKLLKTQRGQKNQVWMLDLSQTLPEEQELGRVFDKFILLCRSREGRLRVIYKILKDGKPIGGA